MTLTEADPKGLVRESYAIEGITPGECRSIFVDWALSLPEGCDVTKAVHALIAHYPPAAPGHPMNAVLAEGLKGPAATGRRGGHSGRMRAQAGDAQA